MYEDALIAKTFCFQFINSYFTLFYVGASCSGGVLAPGVALTPCCAAAICLVCGCSILEGPPVALQLPRALPAEPLWGT